MHPGNRCKSILPEPILSQCFNVVWAPTVTEDRRTMSEENVLHMVRHQPFELGVLPVQPGAVRPARSAPDSVALVLDLAGDLTDPTRGRSR
jgi:hypothetical protein